MTAHHTWPHWPCHQTFFRLPVVTICGVSVPLSVGCHSAATRGSSVARSLKPGSTLRPEQYGQPLPVVREAITA